MPVEQGIYKKLSRLSISTKILLMGIAMTVGFPVILLTWLLPSQRNDSYALKEEASRHIVEATWGVVHYYGQQAATGAMPVPQAQSAAKEALRKARFESGNYVWINDLRPVMIMHPTNPALEGKDISVLRDPNGLALFLEMVRICKEQGEGTLHYMWPKPGHSEPSPKISYVKLYPDWGWIVGTGAYVDDIEAALQRSRNFIYVITGVDFICSLGFCFLAARSFANPIRRASADLDQVADETGGAAGQVASASRQIASRTAQQAAAVEQTSASLEQLQSYCQQSKSSARHIRQLMEEAGQVVQQGDRQMSEMNATIQEIYRSSHDVGKIMNSIEEIAFQTNILALNAAVEAARAGEAGAGFSVVAHEVRSLAQRCSHAAQETAELISRSLTRSEQGAANSSKLTEALAAIVAKIEQVNSVVSEITESVESQTESISQINTAVAQLNQVAQSQAASSGEAATAAEQLRGHSESVRTLTAVLRVVVEGTAHSMPN